MQEFKFPGICDIDPGAIDRIKPVTSDVVKNEIASTLRTSLELSENSSVFDCGETIKKTAPYLYHYRPDSCRFLFDATREDFNLKEVLSEFQIRHPLFVYVVWYHHLPTNYDLIEFDTFCLCWEYIWYELAEELLIVDDDLNWVISVDHSGYLQLISMKGHLDLGPIMDNIKRTKLSLDVNG